MIEPVLMTVNASPVARLQVEVSVPAIEMVELPVLGQLVAAIAGDAAIAPSAMTTANATAL
jgi:hypothetical protein